MRAIAVILFIALVVVHQDFWWWDDKSVVFGFMPIGLAFHVLISVLASVLWLFAVKFCWPRELELADAEDATEGDA